MKQNKLTIRGSGFGLYFFVVLIIFLLYPFFMIKTFSDFIDGSIVIIPIEIMLICIVYFVFLGQKISITDKSLICRVLVPAKRSFPKQKLKEFNVDLSNVSLVTITTIKYFEEHSKEFINQGLGDLINSYRNIYLVSTKGIPARIPMGWATSSIPLIYIALKDKPDQGIAISTKPFSKNGIRKLIAEFKTRNIPLNIDPTLGL